MEPAVLSWEHPAAFGAGHAGGDDALSVMNGAVHH